MATKQRVLRLTLAHYKKDTCSERDCHFFGTALHAKQAATLHASHGVLHYNQVYTTAATRKTIEEFKRTIGAPWHIQDHDMTVELYVRDWATIQKIASDPAFASFREVEEPYMSYNHVVAGLAWVEVYIEDGKVVNVAEDGASLYEPPYEEFVAEGGQLSQLLKG